MIEPTAELQAIRERYVRRQRLSESRLYDPMDPYVTMARQERERLLVRCLRNARQSPVSAMRVLEIGCGGGANLLDLIRLGFEPDNLVGNELRQERLVQARNLLPERVTLLPGDAAKLDLEDGSFDIVLQSTVFTSILDHGFQGRLATHMWTLVRPGGGILWYDFVWDNPRNPDVRGVPLRRIRRLFAEGRIRYWRVTLAPPLGRRLCRLSSVLYPIFNCVPFLRTHILCWIGKPLVRCEASPMAEQQPVSC